MMTIGVNTPANVMVFAVDSTDLKTPKTGRTLAVTISKNGGAFSSISPTVTERGNGWYNIALTPSHTDTLGPLVLRATASDTYDINVLFHVVGPNPLSPEVPADLIKLNGFVDPVSGLETLGYDLNNNNIATVRIENNGITPAKIQDGAFTAQKFAAGAFDAVWSVSSRTLTSFGSLVADIWSHSSRTLTSFGSLVSDVWSHTTRTLTAFSDSAGVTTLLSRVIGTIAAGTHQPQSGDSFARIGADGSNLTALGDSRLNNLDAAVSSRSSSSDVSAIKAKTDQLTFTTPNRVDAEANLALTTTDINNIANAVSAQIDTELDKTPTHYPAGSVGRIVGDVYAKVAFLNASITTVPVSNFDGNEYTLVARDTNNLPTLTFNTNPNSVQKAWFAIKRHASHEDENALILIDTVNGLTRVNGQPPVSGQSGSVIKTGVTDTTLSGKVSFAATEPFERFPQSSYVWEYKVELQNGERYMVKQGPCKIMPSAVNG